MKFCEIVPHVFIISESEMKPHKLTMRWRSSYEYRMFLVKEGCLNIEIDGCTYMCRKNSLFYWLPGSRYRITDVSEFPCCLWAIVFDFAVDDDKKSMALPTLYADEYDAELQRSLKSFEDAPEFEKAFAIHNCAFLIQPFSEILEEFAAKKSGYEKCTNAQFLIILINIWRQMASGSRNNITRNTTADKIISFINANVTENLNCKKIAESLHYSHSYLGRLIRKTTGMPFHEYVQKIKIQKAISLIEGSETPVTEIAQLLGFTDSSHFSRVFKQKTGYTPVSLRKAVLGKTQEFL